MPLSLTLAPRHSWTVPPCPNLGTGVTSQYSNQSFQCMRVGSSRSCKLITVKKISMNNKYIYCASQASMFRVDFCTSSQFGAWNTPPEPSSWVSPTGSWGRSLGKTDRDGGRLIQPEWFLRELIITFHSVAAPSHKVTTGKFDSGLVTPPWWTSNIQH